MMDKLELMTMKALAVALLMGMLLGGTALGADSPEDLFWKSVRKSDVIEEYRAYVEQYPNGLHIGEAWRRIGQLEAAANVGKPRVEVDSKQQGNGEAIANAAAKAVTSAPEHWVIELGAFREEGNVKLLLAKLKSMEVPAYTEKFESPQGLRTRVRVGPFASQDAAERARSRIKTIGMDGRVSPK